MVCGEMGGTCCTDWVKMYLYRVWWEHEGKRLLGKHRQRCYDNIRMHVKGVGVVVWPGLMPLSTVTIARLL